MPQLVYSLLLAGAFVGAVSAEAPRTVFWDGDWMREVKTAPREEGSPSAIAIAKLAELCERALKTGPFTVTAKSQVPPSGDKHDYMSLGPYWWPDPDSEDGLPYIRRDGRTNPDNRGEDREAMGNLCDSVEMLALGAYFLDDDRYGDHAVRLLRTWFLEPETRMNPHLEFGQAIPGRVTGRGIGIIDTRVFNDLLDAVEVLRVTGSLSSNDLRGLKSWFREYLTWLRTSDHGRDEDRTDNNHGTWYDAQCARFALFVGDEDLAREVVDRARTRHVDRQIEPDGRQPHELDRTKSFTYSLFNLLGFCHLARAGDAVGIDLWNYKSSDGGSIREALEFLMPMVAGETKWPYQQLGGTKVSPSYSHLLRVAARGMGEPKYKELADRHTRGNARAALGSLLWR